MKNLKKHSLPVFIVISLVIAACGNSASEQRSDQKISTDLSQSNPVIIFDIVSYDFGILKHNKKARYTFKFRNIGEGTLVITDVRTSCGCTTPEWTKSPVESGESGEIQIEYDSKKLGKFYKSITVYSNAENSQVILNIHGEVRN